MGRLALQNCKRTSIARLNDPNKFTNVCGCACALRLCVKFWMYTQHLNEHANFFSFHRTALIHRATRREVDGERRGLSCDWHRGMRKRHRPAPSLFALCCEKTRARKKMSATFRLRRTRQAAAFPPGWHSKMTGDGNFPFHRLLLRRP